MSLIDLNIEVGKCEGCNLCKNKHVAPLFYGEPKYILLFETPKFYMEEDDLLNRFFAVFTSRGFSKDDFLLMSTVQCMTDKSKRNGRDYRYVSPAKMHREACSSFVTKYVKAVKPRAVVTFGDIPLEEITGQFEGVRRKHGKIVDSKLAGHSFAVALSVAPTSKNLDEIAKVAEALKVFAID